MITSPSSTANDELSAISGLENKIIKVENNVQVNVWYDDKKYWEKNVYRYTVADFILYGR